MDAERLERAARALLYELGPDGQQEDGDLDRAVAELRAALAAQPAQAVDTEDGYESGVKAARMALRSKAICDWLNEPGWSDWKQGVNAAVNEIERALHHDIPAPSCPGGAA